jgi:hypothetical protein
MEIIKRKISLDDYTSREKDNWGLMTATTFNLNVFFTQDGDDMGIGTDMPFEIKGTSPADYKLILDKLNLSGLTSSFNFSSSSTVPTTNVIKNSLFPNSRNPNKTNNDYHISGGPLTGLTDEKLDVIVSYSNISPYQIGFDITKNVNAEDYDNNLFTSGTRVISNNNLDPIEYLIEGDTDPAELALLPITKRGVFYTTSTAQTRTVVSQTYGTSDILFTQMNYNSEGLNNTNVTLSATTRKEYLFGITSSPTVFDDLFIDRGRATAIQSHMQLSEIKNMSDLINYGNGFYNL